MTDATKGTEFIEAIAAELVNHSTATLDVFWEMDDDATKEEQSKALASLALAGTLKIVSILAGYGVDIPSILKPTGH